TMFNQKTATISGAKEAYSSVYVNGILVASADSTTTWTATVSLKKDGNNTVSLVAKSALGVASATRSVTFVRDMTAPKGSIKISNGAASTGSASVTLNLTATDALAGVDAMCFSVDGGKSWTAWETFAVTKAITLAAGYGTKEVQYQVKDKLGNAATFKDTILYEHLPAIPVVTSQVLPATNQKTITLSGTKDAQTSILVNGKVVVPLSNATTWTATVALAKDGNNSLSITSQSSSKKTSAAVSLIVLRDTIPPTGSVKINNGVDTTGSASVTLNLTALDTLVGVDAMRFSVDGGKNWTAWETFAVTKAITLAAGYGTKEVQYQVKDKVDNVSAVYTDTIKVEVAVPTGTSVVTVKAGDRRLFVRERLPNGTLGAEVAYVSKGVNWSPSSVGTVEANLHLEFAKWYQTDLLLMAEMGINTVRVYHDFGTGPDAFKILDEMWRLGIKVIMTVDSPRQGVVADLANITAVVNAYKNHPAILMWAVGNEWDYNNYYGTFSTLQQAAAFTEQAAKLIKTLDTQHPVTTVIADPNIPGKHPLSAEAFPYLPGPYTKDIVNTMVPSVDVWGLNVYRGGSFQDVMAQWSSISGEPAYIAEFGADSYDHRTGKENQAMQGQMDAQLWDEVYFNLSADRTKGTLIGALGFEWNDEWWKNGGTTNHTVASEKNGGQPDGYNDEEWFGLVDINRKVKQTYTVLQNRFVNGQSAVQLDATPVISVASQAVGGTQFKIDDKTVLSKEGGQYGGRGITVAIIDSNTGIRLSEAKTFDTWATGGYGTGTFANTRAFIDYINSLPSGTALAIAIEDDGGFVNSSGVAWSHPYAQEAYRVLESLGSTKIRQVPYNGGWAMVAVKGQGVKVEGYSAAGQPVTIQAQLSLTLNPSAGHR
ncbi:MAG: interleukin-like EMT inducer domain-containing protein, partial [Candidatus Omnitrophica bacterium]|nr:interleukin-like EMT inducer domain-containing protein [Candidatus Omnitrophota bacterium]